MVRPWGWGVCTDSSPYMTRTYFCPAGISLCDETYLTLDIGRPLRLSEAKRATALSVRCVGDFCRSDGRSSASWHFDIDGEETALMALGEARHPVGDGAECRSDWKAEGNFAILEDDPQSRLARSRLMNSAHFGLRWFCRSATPRSCSDEHPLWGR